MKASEVHVKKEDTVDTCQKCGSIKIEVYRNAFLICSDCGYKFIKREGNFFFKATKK